MARNWRNLNWNKITLPSRLWMVLTVVFLMVTLIVAYITESMGRPVWLLFLLFLAMGVTFYSCCRLMKGTGLYDDNPNNPSKSDEWDDELSLKN